MIRIYELNLVMSRDIMTDHTWDPSLAETVPLLWALIQASAAIIITTLPSLALHLSVWFNKKRRATLVPSPAAEVVDDDATTLADPTKVEETGETGDADTPLTSSATTTASVPTQTSTQGSRMSKAERILGMSHLQRFKRSKTPDEYSEEAAYNLDPISGITVTRTVNITTTIDPEEGFKLMYRKYCGVA